MKGQKAGVWAGFVILIYAVGMFVIALSLGYKSKTGPGPGFFPLWVSGILAILAIGYIWISFRKEIIMFSEILPKGRDLINNLSVLAAVLVFMLLLETVGFLTACTVLLFIVLFRHYKWFVALGISFATSLILFMTFQFVLDVPLPVNAFGW